MPSLITGRFETPDGNPIARLDVRIRLKNTDVISDTGELISDRWNHYRLNEDGVFYDPSTGLESVSLPNTSEYRDKSPYILQISSLDTIEFTLSGDTTLGEIYDEFADRDLPDGDEIARQAAQAAEDRANVAIAAASTAQDAAEDAQADIDALTDPVIGDKAFKNPSTDLDADEQKAVRDAIGAGTGDGEGGTTYDADTRLDAAFVGAGDVSNAELSTLSDIDTDKTVKAQISDVNTAASEANTRATAALSRAAAADTKAVAAQNAADEAQSEIEDLPKKWAQGVYEVGDQAAWDEKFYRCEVARTQGDTDNPATDTTGWKELGTGTGTGGGTEYDANTRLDADFIAGGEITNAQFDRLKGVSSPIQTQLDRLDALASTAEHELSELFDNENYVGTYTETTHGPPRNVSEVHFESTGLRIYVRPTAAQYTTLKGQFEDGQTSTFTDGTDSKVFKVRTITEFDADAYLLLHGAYVSGQNTDLTGNITISRIALDLADVAKSGEYSDLSGTPDIPVIPDIPDAIDADNPLDVAFLGNKDVSNEQLSTLSNIDASEKIEDRLDSLEASAGAKAVSAYAYRYSPTLTTTDVTSNQTIAIDGEYTYTLLDDGEAPAGVLADNDFINEWEGIIQLEVRDNTNMRFQLRTTHKLGAAEKELVHTRDYFVDMRSGRPITIPMTAFNSRSQVREGTYGGVTITPEDIAGTSKITYELILTPYQPKSTTTRIANRLNSLLFENVETVAYQLRAASEINQEITQNITNEFDPNERIYPALTVYATPEQRRAIRRNNFVGLDNSTFYFPVAYSDITDDSIPQHFTIVFPTGVTIPAAGNDIALHNAPDSKVMDLLDANRQSDSDSVNSVNATGKWGTFSRWSVDQVFSTHSDELEERIRTDKVTDFTYKEKVFHTLYLNVNDKTASDFYKGGLSFDNNNYFYPAGKRPVQQDNDGLLIAIAVPNNDLINIPSSGAITITPSLGSAVTFNRSDRKATIDAIGAVGDWHQTITSREEINEWTLQDVERKIERADAPTVAALDAVIEDVADNATNITTAQTAADTAQTTADTAKTTADTAKTTADTAQTTADTAQTTADTAQTTADTAKTTADTAQSTADTAQTTADDAATAAAAAQGAANTAQAAADDAQADVDLLTDSAIGSKAFRSVPTDLNTAEKTAVQQAVDIGGAHVHTSDYTARFSPATTPAQSVDVHVTGLSQNIGPTSSTDVTRHNNTVRVVPGLWLTELQATVFSDEGKDIWVNVMAGSSIVESFPVPVQNPDSDNGEIVRSDDKLRLKTQQDMTLRFYSVNAGTRDPSGTVKVEDVQWEISRWGGTIRATGPLRTDVQIADAAFSEADSITLTAAEQEDVRELIGVDAFEAGLDAELSAIDPLLWTGSKENIRVVTSGIASAGAPSFEIRSETQIIFSTDAELPASFIQANRLYRYYLTEEKQAIFFVTGVSDNATLRTANGRFIRGGRNTFSANEEVDIQISPEASTLAARLGRMAITSIPTDLSDDEKTNALTRLGAASDADLTAVKTVADAANTLAGTANTTATTASTTATAASTEASAAATAASTAQSRADAAHTLAGSANTLATTANSTATSANTLAGSANTLATTANSAASTAQTTADTAVTAAGTAQSTADSAATAASTAQTTADSAATAASAAQTTADTAETAAGTAQTRADAAHTLATTANSTATTANTTANAAKAAADAAGGDPEITADVASLNVIREDVAVSSSNGPRFQVRDASTIFSTTDNAIWFSTATGLLIKTENTASVFARIQQIQNGDVLEITAGSTTIYYAVLADPSVSQQTLTLTGEFVHGGITSIAVGTTNVNVDIIRTDAAAIAGLAARNFPTNLTDDEKTAIKTALSIVEGGGGGESEPHQWMYFGYPSDTTRLRSAYVNQHPVSFDGGTSFFKIRAYWPTTAFRLNLDIDSDDETWTYADDDSDYYILLPPGVTIPSTDFTIAVYSSGLSSDEVDVVTLEQANKVSDPENVEGNGDDWAITELTDSDTQLVLNAMTVLAGREFFNPPTLSGSRKTAVRTAIGFAKLTATQYQSLVDGGMVDDNTIYDIVE